MVLSRLKIITCKMNSIKKAVLRKPHVISTKDRTKEEDGKRKTTGKFGTGFLTTHLLSEIVKT